MATNIWTADRRLYLDKDGKPVEADDPGRATLLVNAGGSIPIERAKALGLVAQAERKPGPDDPESSYAYLNDAPKQDEQPADGEQTNPPAGEETGTEGQKAAAPKANKAKAAPAEDK